MRLLHVLPVVLAYADEVIFSLTGSKMTLCSCFRELYFILAPFHALSTSKPRALLDLEEPSFLISSKLSHSNYTPFQIVRED